MQLYELAGLGISQGMKMRGLDIMYQSVKGLVYLMVCICIHI